jgi:hypothetical protein
MDLSGPALFLNWFINGKGAYIAVYWVAVGWVLELN